MVDDFPRFVSPMLARQGLPFDSPDHLFEIKWDGIRCLTVLDRGSPHLYTRNRNEMTERYPDLDCLERLPPGTILDGEVVALSEGRANFQRVLKRELARSARNVSALVRTIPIHYVVFDVLYVRHESVMDIPLKERRRLLEPIVEAVGSERVVAAEGMEEHGCRFFEAAVENELEGVIAKRLDSRYLPGQRTEAWLKIKHRPTVYCAIVGYVLGDENELKSLIIASDENGELRCVGKVGSGLNQETIERLMHLFAERSIPQPIVPCPFDGKWLEPGLYCTVSYSEKTEAGNLRAPVFQELILDDS